jgi:RNA polymerase subunit RPABC4/transcription elongation factor Spt4
MDLLILAALIGVIPAAIAHGKGRSFFLWWIYGALVFIIALPHSILLKADLKENERRQLEEGMKKCPYCAELIKGEAKVCRYCQRDLPMASVQEVDTAGGCDGPGECPNCGSEIPMKSNECPVCKADFTVAGGWKVMPKRNESAPGARADLHRTGPAMKSLVDSE